jgi:hypothetical protein
MTANKVATAEGLLRAANIIASPPKGRCSKDEADHQLLAYVLLWENRNAVQEISHDS